MIDEMTLRPSERPLEITYVRHCHTEGNAAYDAMMNGKRNSFIKAVRCVPSYYWKLTEDGVQQGKMLAEWFQKNIPYEYDLFFASDTIRTSETAGLLNLPGASWRLEPMLRERAFGIENIMSRSNLGKLITWLVDRIDNRDKHDLERALLNGDSNLDMQIRLNILIESESFRRESSGKRVIFVGHEYAGWAIRARIERLTQEQFIKLRQTEMISNGTVIQYSRVNPEDSNIVSSYLEWMRISNPIECTTTGWRKIVRPEFSNEQLLARAEKYPRCSC